MRRGEGRGKDEERGGDRMRRERRGGDEERGGTGMRRERRDRM